MLKIAFPFFLLALLFSNCLPRKKATVPWVGCDVFLGNHAIKQPSVLLMPYENKQWVVFADSLGGRDTFDISFVKKRWRRGRHFLYDVREQGDTLTYCYYRQFYQCDLKSRHSKMAFKIDVGAEPECTNAHVFCPEDSLRKTVTELSIIFFDPTVDPKCGLLAFHKTIGYDQEPPNWSERVSFPEKIFHGRKFQNVETRVPKKKISDFIEPRVFYNPREGIVAFSINGGPFWRLEAMK